MKSYASVDRIEGNFAVCEVELLPFNLSNPSDFSSKETSMMDIPLSQIFETIGDIEEGDILVVEHDTEIVTAVYFKDIEEQHRRAEILRQIMNK